MNFLVKASQIQQVRGFRWIGMDREPVAPKDIPTKRLFYIVKMIWNHSVEEYMRVWDDHRYWFDPEIYNETYMLTAFVVLFRELSHRKDLGPRMQWAMGQIVKWKDPDPDLVEEDARRGEAFGLEVSSFQ